MENKKSTSIFVAIKNITRAKNKKMKCSGYTFLETLDKTNPPKITKKTAGANKNQSTDFKIPTLRKVYHLWKFQKRVFASLTIRQLVDFPEPKAR